MTDRKWLVDIEALFKVVKEARARGHLVALLAPPGDRSAGRAETHLSAAEECLMQLLDQVRARVGPMGQKVPTA